MHVGLLALVMLSYLELVWVDGIVGYMSDLKVDL